MFSVCRPWIHFLHLRSLICQITKSSKFLTLEDAKRYWASSIIFQLQEDDLVFRNSFDVSANNSFKKYFLCTFYQRLRFLNIEFEEGDRLGLFWVVPCLCFKARLSTKLLSDFHANKSHFLQERFCFLPRFKSESFWTQNGLLVLWLVMIFKW